MALFQEKAEGQLPQAPVAEGNLSIIARGMRVVGDIESEGVVKIEGEVKGAVRAGRQVLVAKGGKVEGDIVTQEAIVGGEVRGSIVAEERIELQASSAVYGDVTTKRVAMAEGGLVNGSMRMGDPATIAKRERKELSHGIDPKHAGPLGPARAAAS